MIRILVLHGPNLNLLGEREPEVYGTMTLAELDAEIERHTRSEGADIRTFQSNHEGVLIDRLHELRGWMTGCVLNPGALGHYSWALRDAVGSISKPVWEVHLSDVMTREAWRQVSVLEDVRAGVISGRGPLGYLDAIDQIIQA